MRFDVSDAIVVGSDFQWVKNYTVDFFSSQEKKNPNMPLNNQFGIKTDMFRVTTALINK